MRQRTEQNNDNTHFTQTIFTSLQLLLLLLLLVVVVVVVVAAATVVVVVECESEGDRMVMP
jgi:hypothetical protein